MASFNISILASFLFMLFWLLFFVLVIMKGRVGPFDGSFFDDSRIEDGGGWMGSDLHCF